MIDARTFADHELSPLGRKVLRALEQHTAFANQVLRAQLSRGSIDPAQMNQSDLAQVHDFVVAGVARFTSPTTGEAVGVALRALVEAD